jgi:predicted Zn finger-like uncharacterized protein
LIITCPECNARYKLKNPPEQKKTIRIKCSRCGNEFILTLHGIEQNQSLNILIAHDDFRVVNVIKKLLSKMQFNIEAVYDGQEAFRFIREKKPAVAIVDVALPGMFGFELCEKVKNDPDLKQTKVILVASIYDRTRYKRKPQNLYGADDYIEKHHIPDQMLSKLLRLTSHVPQSEAANTSQQELPKELLKDNREILLEDKKAEKKIDQDREKIRQNETDYINETPQSVKRAEKLSRLIVSDIALYNAELMSQLTLDNYDEKLKMDVEDGVRHLSKKIPEISGQARSFIHKAMKELLEKTQRPA